MSDRDYKDGDRVKRVWNRGGTVIDHDIPSLEGGGEYFVKWDGIGDPEWVKPSELAKGTKPKPSKDHEHYFNFETRQRAHPYFICDCGEYLSWGEAQDRMNFNERNSR